MELIFLDSGLLNKAGHSYKLAKTVSGALARRKLRYRIFGFSGLDTSIAAEIGAVPHFSRSLYDVVDFSPDEIAAIFRAAPAGGSTRSEPRTWTALNEAFEGDLRAFRSEPRTWTALNEAFERDLRALPLDIWQPDNLIVVVAITQNQILGLVRFLRAMPRNRLPRVVCNLMLPPSYLPWGAVSAHGKKYYRAAFRLAAPLIGRSLLFTVENEAMRTLYSKLIGRSLFFTVENAALRTLYRKDFGVQTRILPVPFGASGPPRTMEGRVRLGFFGDSRCDKGFHLLPRAIALCQRDGLDAEFIVQIQHSGWEQRTIEAEAALRALKGVRFLEGELSTEDYTAWTGRTDVMLLPYDPVAFGAARGSGIFAESVAAGRPVIATRGTFAGTSVENNQAEGEVFAPHASEALAAAIARLIPRLPACKARAAERAKDFARSHSPGAYIDVLLAHAKT
jgi:glycosyltransferase involved in cell wall biosynthesis